MTQDWRNYQDEAAEFFRSLGMTAQVDATVQGVRTSHDVDVLATLPYAGLEIRWVVECKQWQTRVTKLHVLALREIVSDIGADRGVLLAEAGFQAGAREAATLTNLQLPSLAAMRLTAETQVYSMRLVELYDRVQACRERYWAIDKHDRIDHGLRPDVAATGYMGDLVISLADDLLKRAFRGIYPIVLDDFDVVAYPSLPRSFATVQALYAAVEPVVSELEGKLTSAESALQNHEE